MTREELRDDIRSIVDAGIKAHMAAQAQAQADAGVDPNAAGQDAARQQAAQESAQLRAMVQEIMREQSSPQVRRDPDLQKGIAFARIARFLAANKGDCDGALTGLRKAYGNDDVSVKALLASDSQSGGVLIAPEFSTDLIEFLRPMSVVRSLNPNVVPMNSGHLSWPKQTAAAAAAYVGEVQRISKTEVEMGSLNLVAKKLAALIPISNDLLRWSSINADAVVRNELSIALNLRADIAFIRGSGGQNVPRGFRNWAPAANLLDCSADGTAASVTEITDRLGSLRLLLRSGDVQFITPGWLMSPRTEKILRDARDGNGNFLWREEMNRGMLEGAPFRVTSQIPENLNVGGSNDDTELYLIDFSDVIIGEAEGIMIDASNNAAYFDGSTIRAAFSTDETVIRAIMLHDLGMRHPESIAVGIGVRWTTNG